MAHRSMFRRWVAATAALAVVCLGTLTAQSALADTAPVDPTNPATPVTVAADALPTVQIDGVVWSQVVVGNTVYAAGSFTTARPAGAAPGVDTVPRHNLLAFDIRTGRLIESFAPVLDGQAMAITASPDGSRIYVVGDFNKVDGQWRVRAAAFDTATGALVPTFRPTLSTRALTVTASDTAVYIGGNFTQAAGVTGGTLQPRAYLAAFSAADGALTPFVADANAPVTALTLTDDESKIVVGGRFTTLSGTSVYGLGAVSPTTGAVLPFPANQDVRNAGENSSITSLYADETGIYGTGYHFGGGGNLEGTFRAHPSTGELIWTADCHGDAYSAYPMGDVVYTASHHHYCGNMGGFPQTEPWTFYFGNAFSMAATGVNTPDIYGYPDHRGDPAPSLLNWYPQLYTGKYTGQGQAGWSVTGNDDYVVFGGEFPGVNGDQQQGLVRFAKSELAPNDQGPQLSGADYTPSVASPAGGTVRVSWSANHDRDNETLTYRLYRRGTSAPVHEESVTAPFWRLPVMRFIDTDLPPGSTQEYRVTATDPFGNVATSDWATVSVADGAPLSPYALDVLQDGARSYWRLGEASGTSVVDWVGTSDATAASGVTRGVTGAIVGDADLASAFDGTVNGLVSTQTAILGPTTFSVEAWIRTTSTTGGKIVGFGNAPTGTSSKYDRHVYMDNAGRISFGTYTGSSSAVRSTTSYNDGEWHHVVGTLSSAGLDLYVDGVRVAGRTDVRTAENFSGHWRIGGDNLGDSWTTTPTRDDYFRGDIDDVAVYGTSLSAQTIAEHHTLGAVTEPVNQAPEARFTTDVADLSVAVDGSTSVDADGTVASYAWDFGDGTTATGAVANHTYPAAGTYTVRLTVTDDDGATAQLEKAVAVVAPANQAPIAAFTQDVDVRTVSVDASGSGDPDGSIESYDWDFGDSATATGRTARHTYTAGGTYTVTLTVTDDRGESAATSRDVTVAADPAASSLSGVVTAGGTPLAGASVNLYAADTRRWLTSVISGEDGAFSAGDVAPGDYKLYVKPDEAGYANQWIGGRAFETATVTTVAGATSVDVVLSGTHALSGVVSTGAGPLSGASVNVYTADTRTWVRSGTSGANGRYSVAGLPEGSYKLYVQPNEAGYPNRWHGGASFDGAMVVTVAGPVSVDVVLSGTHALTGVVSTGAGPLSGASVNVYTADTRTWVRSGASGADGRYSVGGLPEGSYKLYVQPNEPGFANRWVGGVSFEAAPSVAVSGPTTSNIVLDR